MSPVALPTIRPAPVLPEEHHDTADEEDHEQKEATEKAKPIHAYINRATSTSTSASVPLLVQTRPRRDLDTDSGVPLDPNQTRRPNMSSLQNIISKLRGRIHTMEVLLATMTTPVQSPAQALVHSGYIKRISDLTHEATTYLMDIDATELSDFRTSIINIGCRASAIYDDLCTWEASICRGSYPAWQQPR